MNKKQIVETIESYLEPILAEFKFELIDVEYVKEGPNYYLRIYIDKEGGINIQDCQITSRTLEKVLEQEDPIKEPYILEVSSPGLDRVLKKDREFEYFKGRLVDVKLYKAINGEKNYTATLVNKTEDTLYLDDEGSALEFEMKDVAVVRLAITF
ncbi:MAG: ribosome maturation factor RimP [Cellulosilyticum sp.]|nr:ribosome maturation factor RimP [Cellulosilyticum sp.]MEE1071083.1 ribosome maturation factor RimP [Cellulosilyticum sp.]